MFQDLKLFKVKQVSKQSWQLRYLQFPFCKLCAEGNNFLCGDSAALWLVLGHLILQSDEADSRALLFLQAKEIKDALVVIQTAVDENEQDLDGRDGHGH